MKLKKYIASAMALLMVLCMVPSVSHAATGYLFTTSGVYTMSTLGLASGYRVTIGNGINVTLIGDSTVTYTDFSITCWEDATLTLSNVNIDDSGNDGVCPLVFMGTGNTLNLAEGTVCTLKGGLSCAGVGVGSGAELTIGGVGTLNATGQGQSGEHSAAGIGGAGIRNDDVVYNDSGRITITGGIINATGGYYGAGIGGGSGGDGTVVITGGTVNANGGNNAAGIGGGMFGGGTVTIEGGTVNASAIGGACIGGGYRNPEAFSVKISGGTVTTANNNAPSGIGTGLGGSGGSIEISGGTIFSHRKIDSGTAGSDGSMKISGSAAVFLENDSVITPPTTGTHAYYSYDAGTTAVYGIGVPWTDAFNAYLRVCTLSYDANGGMGVPPGASQLYGTSTSVLPGDNIAHGAWAFTGWNTKADGTGTAYQAGDEYPFTGSETLFAQWDGTDVAAAPNNAAYGSVTGAGEYEPGSQVTVTATPKAGYYFTGWYAGDTLVSSSASYAFTAGGDVSLTARFSGMVTVTAVSGNSAYGGVAGGGEVVPGTSVTLTATPNAGYYFTGWYSGESRVSTSASYTFAASESLTLTARFAAQVKITAAPNNAACGSVTGGGEVVPGTSVTVAATANAGYYFTGWYNGDTLVSSNASYTFAASESLTLTARFASRVKVTAVSGNAAQGSVSGGGEVVPGTSVTLTATANAGFYFAGWFTGKTLVSSSASYTFTAARDAAFTAQFGSVGIPESIKATATYNKITVSWSKASGATGYCVYRAASENGAYRLVKTVTSTSYSEEKLQPGATLYFKVRPFARTGRTYVYGGYSSVVSATTALGQVTGLKATAAGPASVSLSWNAVAGAGRYQVWRTDLKDGGEGDYTLVAVTSARKLTNASLTADHTYYYRVIACNRQSTVFGGFSAVVAATPVMPRVTGLKASGSAKSAKLSWSKVKGAVKYEVWVSDAKDGAFTLLGETKSNQFAVSAPSVRWYKVRAYCLVINTRHYGAYSAAVGP